jgi:hypothetical protein
MSASAPWKAATNREGEARTRSAFLGFAIAGVGREKPAKRAVRNDPKLIAAARELRDRWLERVNSGTQLPLAIGKYDPSRRLLDVA